MKIVIKGNPLSVNATYKTARNRRIYLSEKAREYSKIVVIQARQQWKKKPLEKDLEVSYWYFFKDKRVRDHMNFQKLLNDFLNGIVWIDDRQIKISHHYTKFDKNNTRIELEIKEITD